MLIFMSRYVVSPIRGSFVLLMTSTFKSGEYQVSVVIVIGCSLPTVPAGIVRVSCVPRAATPSIVCVPQSVLRHQSQAKSEI